MFLTMMVTILSLPCAHAEAVTTATYDMNFTLKEGVIFGASGLEKAARGTYTFVDVVTKP